MHLTAEVVDAMALSDEDTLSDESNVLTSFMGVPIVGSPQKSPPPRPSTPAPDVDRSSPKDVIDLTSSVGPSRTRLAAAN